MPNYTQSELLVGDFASVNSGILGGLLNVGLYIFGATSKVGKTMIATSLANAVANGTDYLGKSNVQGKVIYFDNDNYPHEAKNRINALGFKENENIMYYFGEEASSLHDIKDEIKYLNNKIKEVKLIIIDCYINLSEFSNCEQKFEKVYPKLKDFRDFIVEKKLTCIIIHHIKKGEANGQDKLLGPKAMSAATTGSIILNVETEFSKIGQLEFILRHRKEIVPIMKDENNISWILSNECEAEESIDKNLLNLINTVLANNNVMEGTAQEIVMKAKMDINPVSLFKFINRNKKCLLENGIVFQRKRTHKHRIISLRYDPTEKDE